MLPEAVINIAPKAASRIVTEFHNPSVEMAAATITEIKVIKQFNGRVNFMYAVNFSRTFYRLNEIMMDNLNKLLQSKLIYYSEMDFPF